MISNTAKKLNSLTIPSPTPTKKVESFAGYTAKGVAWKTQIIQAKTTHGKMDIRLWRSVK